MKLSIRKMSCALALPLMFAGPAFANTELGKPIKQVKQEKQTKPVKQVKEEKQKPTPIVKQEKQEKQQKQEQQQELAKQSQMPETLIVRVKGEANDVDSVETEPMLMPSDFAQKVTDEDTAQQAIEQAKQHEDKQQEIRPTEQDKQRPELVKQFMQVQEKIACGSPKNAGRWSFSRGYGGSHFYGSGYGPRYGYYGSYPSYYSASYGYHYGGYLYPYSYGYTYSASPYTYYFYSRPY